MHLARRAAFAAGLFLFATWVSAEEPGKRIPATRVDRADAPTIDGDLGDAVWRRAEPRDDFRQVFPFEDADPSQRTEVRILYDDRALYVAVMNFDDRPDLVRATLLQRDPPIQNDDSIRVMIDPQLTRRDGYYFATNALGAREDGLLQNAGGFVGAWNGVWNVRARRMPEGWSAEFAIPFRTVAFDPQKDEWGFQVVRVIPRTSEEIRWSMIDQNRGRVDLSGVGRATGIEARARGIGVDAQGLWTGTWTRDEAGGEETLAGEPSANIFYRLTPSLNAVITTNTDFSDAPLDNRQVNTGRFSLFFPETRSFFVEDTSVFEFGGGATSAANGRPFFSRRIGLVDGEAVDLDVGGKLAGRAGAFDMGALVVRTGETADLAAQTLGVARVAARVSGASKIGFIATAGDSAGESDATTIGADAQLRSNAFLGLGVLRLDAAYVAATRDGETDAFASAELAYPNDRWGWSLRAREVGEAYDPALGFTNRPGVREAAADLRRRWRPAASYWRRFDVGVFASRVTDFDGGTLDENASLRFNGENNAGDGFALNAETQRFDVREPFAIAGVGPVPAGEYRWEDYFAEVFTTRQRRLSAFLGGTCCEAWDGERLIWFAGFEARPNRFLQLSAEYEQQRYELPRAPGDLAAGEEADFHIHIATADARVTLTPRLFADAEAQYDTASEEFSLLSRVRWEPRPQTEILLAVAHSADADPAVFPREFRARGTSAVIRLGNTFRL